MILASRLLSCIGVLPLIAGGLTVIIGVGVLIGWLTGNSTWVQLRPDLAPMQGNTAIGFILCGIALIGLHLGWHRLAALLGAMVTVMGGLTLSQYLLGIDLGIDQLLFRHSITIHTSHPGRMAPNTALAFMAGGMALVLSRYAFAGALLGALVFALGVVALLGYMTGIPGIFAWSGFSHMALLSALGFTLVGMGLAALIFEQRRRQGQFSMRWMPFVAGAAMTIVGVLFWEALRSQETEQVHRAVEITARSVGGEITARIDSMTTALSYLAERGITRGWRSTEDWRSDALLTVGAFPGFENVEWIDQNFVVRVVAGRAMARQLVDSPESTELLHKTLDLAQTRGIVVVAPFPFEDGEMAFRIVVPLISPDRPQAYLSGVFSAKEVFAALSRNIAPNHAIMVLCEGREVYRHGDIQPGAEDPWMQTLSIDLAGAQPWQVVIAPQSGFLALGHTALPEVVLAASLLTALLLGLTIRFGERAMLRAEGFESAVQERTGELEEAMLALAAENAERQRSEGILRRTQAVGQLVSAELDLEKVVSAVTDAATELTGAAFGAFYYKVPDQEGEAFMLYTLSGARREAFAKFPMPRSTDGLQRVSDWRQVIRIDDLTKDPRYSNSVQADSPDNLTVVSYMAVPVISRSGEVWGGLFFGHPQPGIFSESKEEIAVGLAAQAAIAMDNARLYEAERTAKAEALAANRAKDKFIAVLGHELRNPLSAVRNALEVLELHGEDEATRLRMHTIIDRQLNQLSYLVDELLDISRIERGKLTLHPERLDLVRLVREFLDSERATIEAAGLELTVELPTAPLWVDVDPTRLTQVMANLVANARKFTAAGGRIRICVTANSEAGQAVVTVSDNGCGIAPQDLDHVFEPFVQTEKAADQMAGGLGLGLSIVKGLINAHGGEIEAFSEGPDRGSEFTFCIPLQSALPKEAVQATASDATPRWRILVIDDHRGSAEGLGELLTLYGYQVEIAYDGPSGLEVAHRFHPEVVICDIGLPEMDGYQVARKLRLDWQPAPIWLLALTGYSDDESGRRACEAGFDHRLTKPVNPTALKRLLASLPHQEE